MVNTKAKRIEQIEAKLTPVQAAIRRADELRQAPSLLEYTRPKDSDGNTAAKLAKQDSLSTRFKELAKVKHPGNSPADHQAAKKLYTKYWIEYDTRINLINTVQSIIRERTERAGAEAALKLQTLTIIILRDSFSRTAEKAAEWVEEYKTADKEEEQNRQIMLDELASYYVNTEPGSRSLPLGGVTIVFPSAIEGWIDTIKGLIYDVFRHKEAIKYIQDQLFDGHDILARDVEARLVAVIATIKDTVRKLNEYLDIRVQLFGEEWKEVDDWDGLPGGLIGEMDGRLRIDVDAIRPTAKSVKRLADQWIKEAKIFATINNLRIQEGFAAAAEYADAALKEYSASYVDPESKKGSAT